MKTKQQNKAERNEALLKTIRAARNITTSLIGKIPAGEELELFQLYATLNIIYDSYNGDLPEQYSSDIIVRILDELVDYAWHYGETSCKDSIKERLGYDNLKKHYGEV